MRLDHYLTQQKKIPSRARAQAMIKAGLVMVNGAPARKASQTLLTQDVVTVEGDIHQYVSRGGVKLEGALKAFEVYPGNKICLDLGASTGGFTEVLLEYGAAKVYAVDVGRDQLHKKLLNHPRVENLEQTHAKDLNASLVPDPIDILVCDVSFISIKKALPFAMALCLPGAKLITLIKPQFEVGRSQIGKGGIVKTSYENSDGLCEDMVAWIEQEGWSSCGTMNSPIEGGDGNKEFLLGAIKKP